MNGSPEHPHTAARVDRALQAATYHRAPATLRRSVNRALHAGEPSRILPRWLGLAWAIPRPAWAMACALLVASNAYLASTSAPARDPIADDLVNGHIRALVSEHPFDVASSNRHTVKPWFAGKIDYAPAVADFSSEGFALVGGRVDYIGARPVATLVYQRDSHLIDVSLWPRGANDPREASVSIRGYAVRHWAAGGMSYWIVSDADTHEIDTLQRLLQHE